MIALAASLFALAGVGTVLGSIVQIRIISRHGFGHFHRTSFEDVYWHELSRSERLMFWGGVGLFTIPSLAIFAIRPTW
jgi:hypothetical protein